MKKKKLTRIIVGSLIVLILCITSYLLYDPGRPTPIPIKQNLHEGVTYHRVVRFIPYPLIAHIIEIDTKTKGIQLLITPPDSDGETPLNARTTSQFLDEFDLQIAINGDGFLPWWSHSPADYYPHSGDPVTPFGFTASIGEVYSMGIETAPGVKPTLYISRRNVISFNNPPGKIYNAISGDRMIVLKGEVAPDLDDQDVEPRTAIGTNRNGRYLYLIVIDGRQPFYSRGATFTELAQLLINQGVYVAMSLDGGGSSTMVIEGEDGQPVILNSPIDNYIPGRERPVANHLGVYVK
ncbi:MAG: phosphodiester glycosidase family protein [Anaerolineae bacterium]|nr:phosphodiester glycosidase family protein [Anaerolineae bacterium]MCI0608862.1 phosphodiester glycosidase family protein [Anaerolineae bacterium]